MIFEVEALICSGSWKLSFAHRALNGRFGPCPTDKPPSARDFAKSAYCALPPFVVITTFVIPFSHLPFSASPQ